MRSILKKLSLLQFTIIGVIILSCASCEKSGDDDSGDDSSGASGSGAGASSSNYKGTWVRLIGASGDRTDIAIGNISGEGENRVYMCEFKGAVGLYKGNISGNIIKWDATHRLPDTEVGLKDGKMSFYYPSVTNSLKTYYDRGTWSSRCGPLSNSGGSTPTTPTAKPKGQFKIIVNRPTGICASSNKGSNTAAWVAYTVVANRLDADGNECCSSRVIAQGPGPAFSSPNNSWTYTSITGVHKLYWEFSPSASTWPTSCIQKGSAVIDFEGQVKTIIIW